MKILSLPVKDVCDIVGEQSYCGCSFRKSSFCYEVEVEGKRLFYNTLTKECLFTDENDDKNYVKKELSKKWFYVPNEFDELKFVDDIRDVFNYTLCQAHGIKGYTILPTTDCNARCFYCFEAKSQKITMSDEIANRVVEYIDRSRCKESKELNISWFGGEPLYNQYAIDIICTGLKEKYIDYKSFMISNGYLFDKPTIEKAKELWNLYKVQITLDGTEKIYNKVKAYKNKDKNAYERVLNNIDNLLDSGIKVAIRLNIDAYNMKDVKLLVNELACRYKGKKGLSVYSHTLFEDVDRCNFKRTNERRKEICDFQRELEKDIASLGLYRSPYIVKSEFMTHFCMADSLNSIVILPDGHLTKCEGCLDDNYVGNIYDGNLNDDMLAYYGAHCEKLEECKTCLLYPECIRLKVCHESDTCHKEFREKKILDIKDCIVGLYHSYLEKKKNESDEENKKTECEAV